MVKKTLFFIWGLLFLVPLSLRAYDFKVGDLYYTITNSEAPYTMEVTYEVNDYSNYLWITAVVIPEAVVYEDITYNVTGIGEDAFTSCLWLNSITIPHSVTSIGWGAFSGCAELTIIDIPNSVTTIRGWAFTNCQSLTSTTIPNSVTTIETRAFSGCTGLNSLVIPNSVTSIGLVGDL